MIEVKIAIAGHHNVIPSNPSRPHPNQSPLCLLFFFPTFTQKDSGIIGIRCVAMVLKGFLKDQEGFAVGLCFQRLLNGLIEGIPARFPIDDSSYGETSDEEQECEADIHAFSSKPTSPSSSERFCILPHERSNPPPLLYSPNLLFCIFNVRQIQGMPAEGYS